MKVSQVANWFYRRHIIGGIRKSLLYPLLSNFISSTRPNLSNTNPADITLQEIAFPKSSTKPLDDLKYETLDLSTLPDNKHVVTVKFNRPKQLNAFNLKMWNEYLHCFQTNLPSRKDARVAIVTGSPKSFSTGMDLSVFLDIDATLHSGLEGVNCEGRRKEALQKIIQFLQDSVSSAEQTPIPVIAAVSGYCVGGAVDIITACDLRYCTADAKFSIKETDLAMVSAWML